MMLTHQDLFRLLERVASKLTGDREQDMKTRIAYNNVITSIMYATERGVMC